MTSSGPKWGTLFVCLGVAALLATTLAQPVHATSPFQSPAMTQDTVRGTVSDSITGDPIPGVTVQLVGTDIGTVTGADGRYALAAPPDGSLAFTRIGYLAVQVPIGGRRLVDVALAVSAAQLHEIVVTGYMGQRRVDITGAVSSVNMESVAMETSSSMLHRLHGNVAGVTVDASGSPGARSTVRIRGISSFQNNNPLYIIDGLPVEDPGFANWLNPNDIESIQVLKDASAASIYGARANNGVVIIETRKGRAGAPRISLDVRFGVNTPARGYDDFLILDSMDYFEVVRRSHVNAGLDVPTNIYGSATNPTIPAYIWPNDGTNQTTSADLSQYSWPDNLIMPGSPGTNWWQAVFGPAQVRDVTARVSGGSANERYAVSFSYYDEEGTAAFNRFQRGTVRLNTDFTIGRLVIGENVNLSLDEHYGGMPFDPGGFAEGGIIGKNMMMQPVVPVYDVGGNFASAKAIGLGNHTNPLKAAWANKDDVFRNVRMLGNVFAHYSLTDQLRASTTFGFNVGQGTFRGFNPIFPENSEPSLVNSISESSNTFVNWTWSNTVTFSETFGGVHNTSFLLGQEANRNSGRFMTGSIANLRFTTDINSRYIQDAIGDPATKNVFSVGGFSTLLSYFGKADYNYDERYYATVTLRRDGSSRLGPENRWGTFPAFSVGWRLSEEPFLSDNLFFTNLMLRAGWGVTGNENIASGRTVDLLGGTVGQTFYDIAGTGSSVLLGFRQTAWGNPDLKWEENRSVNLGLDAEFAEGRASLVVDLYQRDTDNLLFDPRLPGTAGLAAPPIVNIGKMSNRGIDFAVGYRGTFRDDVNWHVNFNGAHYRNEIVRIDGEQEFFFGPITTRFATEGTTINMVGHPIGSFYGLQVDGIFQNQAEIDALNAQAPGGVYQEGAAPGRFRFRDINGDGRVTAADRTIIGSPHPDFTAGLNLGMSWRNWDMATSLFGTFGNDIFDVQKEFYVFRLFNSNVRRDLLTDAAVVENGEVINPNARYPRLDVNDDFSREISSFYVEDGSYVRLRSLQLGYTVPPGRFGALENMRVYLQAENLFTITGYSGLDPALPASAVTSAGMDVRDQARGIDRGVYPTSRTFTLGFGIVF
jgi:TonB-dependent starch-binding outer membrane protein SusC